MPIMKWQPSRTFVRESGLPPSSSSQEGNCSPLPQVQTSGPFSSATLQWAISTAFNILTYFARYSLGLFVHHFNALIRNFEADNTRVNATVFGASILING